MKRPSVLLVLLAATVIGLGYLKSRKSLQPRERTVTHTSPTRMPSVKPASRQPGAAERVRQDELPLSVANISPVDRRAELIRPIDDFEQWFIALRRRQAPSPAEGQRLARDRRAALKELIALDPREALARAIPRSLRHELPAVVQAELEKPIDAFGRFEVLASCFGTDTKIERFATIDDRRYATYTYGQRLEALTKSRLPLHGVAIDDQLALAEEPYRLLDLDETTRPASPGDGLQVVVGDQMQAFTSRERLEAWHQQMARGEAAPGPEGQLTSATETGASTWTFGEKRVLWIRVEFSDDPGLPGSDARIAAMMVKVDRFYRDVSNDRCSFVAAVVPEALRLSRPKSYFNTGRATYSELWNEAVKLAREYDVAHGGIGTYNPDRYDRYIIWSKQVPVYGFGGIANVGGTGLMINVAASFDAPESTVIHELGHNHGLYHSHGWIPSGPSPLEAGSHMEYGDAFDVMGDATLMPAGHFNAKQKERLSYLSPDDITTVTTSGVYRIYQHDLSDAHGVRALRISAGGYEVWLEHYQQIPRTTFELIDRLREGILVHLAKYPASFQGPGTYLIDSGTTTKDDFNDAPISLGEQFVGPASAFAVTPVAKGGDSSRSWIDVHVTFGAFGDNHNPTVAATAPAALIPARTDVTFAATGSDPDGDLIHYHWDFGDGSSTPSGQSLIHRYLKGGNYTIQCTALDGRGGFGTTSYTVVVDDPLLEWKPLTGGEATDQILGLAHGGGRYLAVGYNALVLASSDGVAWTRRSGMPGHNYRCVLFGDSRFVAVGARYAAVTGSSSLVPSPVIATSVDGVAWTDASPQEGAGSLQSVAFGASCYVSVGDKGSIFRSTDARNWNPVAANVDQTLYGVRYAAGYFVAVGDKGTILTSADGLVWQNRTLLNDVYLSGVACHRGLWFAPNGTRAWLSTDAAEWQGYYLTVNGGDTISAGPLTTWNSPELIFTAGRNRVAYSEEGLHWAAVEIKGSASSDSLAAACEVDGVITVVGYPGRIYQSRLRSSVVVQPAIRSSPESVVARSGDDVTFQVAATGSDLRYIWKLNGRALPGATGPGLTINGVDPSQVGLREVAVTNAAGTRTAAAILGLSSTDKVLGAATELIPANIIHANGNVFDQVLLNGRAAAITADYLDHQITRLSYIDLDDDIVQVEFSGPGTLSLVLDSPPAAAARPKNYHQAVDYVKGHAGIVITGADERTNLSVFSVGRVTAVNQALFKDEITYDGIADIAFVAISTTNGKFGGLRTANAHYFASAGFTGLYAPGVAFQGPVYLGDISAYDSAQGVILAGSTADARITGGDLGQANDRPVQVSGLARLTFYPGSDSHGHPLAEKHIQTRLLDNGVDVTDQITANATP